MYLTKMQQKAHYTTITTTSLTANWWTKALYHKYQNTPQVTIYSLIYTLHLHSISATLFCGYVQHGIKNRSSL